VVALVLGAAWLRDRSQQGDATPRPSSSHATSRAAAAPAKTAPAQQRARSRRATSSTPNARKRSAAPASRTHGLAAPAKTVPALHKRTRSPSARSSTPSARRRAAPSAKPTSGFVPARIWSWPAAKVSAHYRVRFFLDGRKILDVRTKRPRLVLSKAFTFRPGHYRWTVVPVSPSGKAERAIVDSTFLVAKR
jgi:hypothetical protein